VSVFSEKSSASQVIFWQWQNENEGYGYRVIASGETLGVPLEVNKHTRAESVVAHS
jgi:hypothetical protein